MSTTQQTTTLRDLSIGQFIAQVRARSGLSQQELAERRHVTRSAQTNLEASTQTSTAILDSVAKALDARVDILWFDSSSRQESFTVADHRHPSPASWIIANYAEVADALLDEVFDGEETSEGFLRVARAAVRAACKAVPTDAEDVQLHVDLDEKADEVKVYRFGRPEQCVNLVHWITNRALAPCFADGAPENVAGWARDILGMEQEQSELFGAAVVAAGRPQQARERWEAFGRSGPLIDNGPAFTDTVRRILRAAGMPADVSGYSLEGDGDA